MTPNLKTACLLAAILAAAALSSGCHIIWVALEKTFPKERVPARFKLPANKTVLVFPDDLDNPLSYPPVKRRLSQKLSAVLEHENIAAKTIPYDRLIELKSNEPEFNLMSILKIGRKLGADLVIYVNIEQFTLKDNPVDTLWRGRLAGRVKVVDVLKGRIWPEESAGYPVRVNAPLAESHSDTFGGELAKKLAEDFAVEVAQLFHAHYVERARPKQTDSPFDE